jgi:hypothetical protein
MRKILIALALLAAAAASAPAYCALGTPEEAVETSTTATTLPATLQGVIVAKFCPTCAMSVLRLTAKSQFFVGRSAVSLADLHKYIAAAGASRNMVILYDRRLHTVTRIIVSGTLPAAKR